jgi:hypothetical protein
LGQVALLLLSAKCAGQQSLPNRWSAGSRQRLFWDELHVPFWQLSYAQAVEAGQPPQRPAPRPQWFFVSTACASTAPAPANTSIAISRFHRSFLLPFDGQEASFCGPSCRESGTFCSAVVCSSLICQPPNKVSLYTSPLIIVVNCTGLR